MGPGNFRVFPVVIVKAVRIGPSIPNQILFVEKFSMLKKVKKFILMGDLVIDVIN